MLAASRLILPLVKEVGNVVAVADEPKVNPVPEDADNVPVPFPVI